MTRPLIDPVVMAEIWRGPFLESAHYGHAVIYEAGHGIVESWGDPDAVVLPRSSSKMIQALPLIESGAERAFGLTSEQLALACASHNGAAIHTEPVRAWLDALGLNDDALRCGPQTPRDPDARQAMVQNAHSPCQHHNNCSGKHTGFLTLARHLGAGPEYVDADHPVQKAVKEAFERTTDEASPGHAIDGCSAPNFATSLTGMARAMAHFASAADSSAEHQLTTAMMRYPELVAGEGRACTRLMRACNGQAALKTGAEAFFVAILPEQKRGIALKIVDGGTRAAECAIAALLVRLGVLDPAHPEAVAYTQGPIRNWRKIETGVMRAAACLLP